MLRNSIVQTTAKDLLNCRAQALKSFNYSIRFFSQFDFYSSETQIATKLRNITNDTKRLLEQLKKAQEFVDYFPNIKRSNFASSSEKRPKTSYHYFYSEKYNLYRSENPGLPPQEITKKVAAEWNTFTQAEKKTWALDNGCVSSESQPINHINHDTNIKEAATSLQGLSIDMDRLYRDFIAFRKEVAISGSFKVEMDLITKPSNVKKISMGKINLYTVFYQEHYHSTKWENPNWTPQQITGFVSKQWGEMTREEKIEYRDMKGLNADDFPVK